jgi:hypothetical protein
LLCLLLSELANAQTDSSYMMKIHFLYGSSPLHKHRKTEKKEFGGLHGGHVTIQAGGRDIGFERWQGFHVFPRRRNMKAAFLQRSADTVMVKNRESRTLTIYIPLSHAQFDTLMAISGTYCAKAPYDYAFFGMRCAAATQDILARLGLMKKRSRRGHIVTAFYPKRLRKRLIRMAGKNGYAMQRTEGRSTRRWERD